ncbi:MFS transporter [Actinacidiphila rubida]|uniref:MFS transporter n=1 Tax=Actinacidiphila rubida TaxID=310780 RepID=UPI00159F2B9B|nr:MFS transporter [Actinacidiphila rubida]
MIALAVSMFAIGTTEFVVVGLIPDLSGSFGVSISTAGLLVTCYALGIAIGGPFLTAVAARAERKKLLVSLMALFVVGNVLAGLAPNFGLLLVFRLLTSFTHAVFLSSSIALGITLVDDKHRACAIAAIFGGLTIALVIGVPLGTFLGNAFSWRVPFFAVAGLGALALAADVLLLPATAPPPAVALGEQLRTLARPRLVVALVTILLGFGGQILAYTYVAPFLEKISGFPQSSLSVLLFVFGVAAAIGNFAAGPLADRWPVVSAAAGLSILALVLLAMTFAGRTEVGAVVVIVLWGATGFGLGPVLQNLATRAAPEIAHITGSLAASAFNLGIAGGSVFGGVVVSTLGVGSVTWIGAAIVAVSALLAIGTVLKDRGTPEEAGEPAELTESVA